MTGISVADLSKRFGGLIAVESLNMDFPTGLVTGLIGPNGAGKTTVVNLIAGTLAVSSGTVRFGDMDISALPPHEIGRLGIARTFQNIRLLPNESVLDNVALGYFRHERASLLECLLDVGRSSRDSRRGREVATELLERLGLAAFAGQPAGALAYGHQRRIEIARAMAMSPQALLLDEPVAGMNDVEAAELGAIFRDIAASGVAVLLIEHNMRFVAAICDRLFVLDSGKLIAEGEPDSVLARDEVIRAYLGEADADDS